MATIHLAINGRPCRVDADPQISLLTVLREHLDLIGTKYGCGEGRCGACTVLIDGRAQRSCITRAETVAQKQITTIEGLARGERLHPVGRESGIDRRWWACRRQSGSWECNLCLCQQRAKQLMLLVIELRPVAARENGVRCRSSPTRAHARNSSQLPLGIRGGETDRHAQHAVGGNCRDLGQESCR